MEQVQVRNPNAIHYFKQPPVLSYHEKEVGLPNNNLLSNNGFINRVYERPSNSYRLPIRNENRFDASNDSNLEINSPSPNGNSAINSSSPPQNEVNII